VSSPGPERPLRTSEHFARAVGERVQLKLVVPAGEGRRSYAGTLVAAGDETLTLASDDGVVEVPLEAVRRARLTEERPR
jgi:ribosome maturation factor RimP